MPWTGDSGRIFCNENNNNNVKITEEEEKPHLTNKTHAFGLEEYAERLIVTMLQILANVSFGHLFSFIGILLILQVI